MADLRIANTKPGLGFLGLLISAVLCIPCSVPAQDWGSSSGTSKKPTIKIAVFIQPGDEFHLSISPKDQTPPEHAGNLYPIHRRLPGGVERGRIQVGAGPLDDGGPLLHAKGRRWGPKN